MTYEHKLYCLPSDCRFDETKSRRNVARFGTFKVMYVGKQDEGGEQSEKCQSSQHKEDHFRSVWKHFKSHK